MNKAEKKRILDFAYNVLHSLFNDEKIDVPESDLRMGVFVTLRKKGSLRGCIGYMQGICPLYEMLSLLVRDAATCDYRFPPVEESELKDISIEISLLTPMRKIKSLDEFTLGKDGLMMNVRGWRAVFLPSVAEETGWDEKTFFEQLSLKAGLGKDAYLDEDASFEIFQAEVIA